jgi:hypothetical protein
MGNLAAALDNVNLWHVIALTCIALGTRILPRLSCAEARGMDAYYHLLAARKIRENRFRLPHTFEEYLLPGTYDYPPLFHYLLAFFPESRHLEVERWVSAVCDALHGSVVYFFSIYYLRKAHFSQSLASMGLWVTVLFLLSPALTYVGTGPRAYQGTPRTLGELFFMLSISCSVIHFLDGGLLFLLGAGLFGGLLLLTSKFGTQVLVFFYMIFLFWFREATWVMVLLMSFFIAWLFSGGHYKDVLLGHWEHCRYYRKAISERFYMVRDKNRWVSLINLFREFNRAPLRAARIVLLENTYILLLIKNPQIVYLLFVSLLTTSGYTRNSAFLFVWIGAAALAFLLTSLKPFLYLGEADRYFEYALFPQLLLLAVSGYAFPFFYWMAGYGVLLYGVFVSGFIYRYSQEARDLPEFEELVAFIRSDKNIQRVLPIYLNEANRLAYESGKGIAHFPGNFRERFFPVNEFLCFYDKVYPFPNSNLRPLMERYGYDVIYFSERDMGKAGEHDVKYDLRDWKTLFANASYKVLKPL